jgi:hypothetical protein
LGVFFDVPGRKKHTDDATKTPSRTKTIMRATTGVSLIDRNKSHGLEGPLA